MLYAIQWANCHTKNNVEPTSDPKILYSWRVRIFGAQTCTPYRSMALAKNPCCPLPMANPPVAARLGQSSPRSQHTATYASWNRPEFQLPGNPCCLDRRAGRSRADNQSCYPPRSDDRLFRFSCDANTSSCPPYPSPSDVDGRESDIGPQAPRLFSGGCV